MRIAVVHNRDQSGVINVFGPQNRERYNPRTVELVAKALEQGGHTVRVIDGNMNVVEQLKDFMPRVVAGERPGMVFNMAYGIQGVSRYTHLPAMLEMLGVPYVGSGPMAHGLALDKVIAKIMFRDQGLPTAKFWNFASADDHFDDMSFPVIVKPKMEAVSYGISVVNTWDELREAVKVIIDEFGQHVLVEEFISGRELAIGLLGNGQPDVLPIVEIDFKGDPDAIQTAEEKLRAPLGKLCPAPLTEEQTASLQELARRAFRALDLRDFARVDLRLDKDDNPYILEINSMASLGRTGTFVHAAQTAGYTYESLINKMLDVAAVRYFGMDYAAEEQPDEREGRSTAGSTQAKVRSYLRGQEVTTEDTLRRMVDTPTPPGEVEAVNALGEWLTAQFSNLGFTASVIPRVGAGNVVELRNHDQEEDDVLLIGHLDTARGQAERGFRVEGNRIFGTGVAECKGGLAVALSALRALRFARQLRRIRCAVVLSADGTLDGSAARDIITAAAERARYVIGVKAGEPDGSLVVSRSGRASYRLETAYRRGGRERVTAGEVVEHMCSRVEALQELDKPDEGIQALVTHLNIETVAGRLPDRSTAQLLIRFRDPAAFADVDAAVHRIADQRFRRGLRLAVTGGKRRDARPESPSTEEFLARAQRVATRLNSKLAGAHRLASGDVCYIPAEKPVLDGFGPVGSGARTEAESILRSSLVDRAALLAMVMVDIASDRS